MRLLQLDLLIRLHLLKAEPSFSGRRPLDSKKHSLTFFGRNLITDSLCGRGCCLLLLCLRWCRSLWSSYSGASSGSSMLSSGWSSGRSRGSLLASGWAPYGAPLLRRPKCSEELLEEFLLYGVHHCVPRQLVPGAVDLVPPPDLSV